MAAIQATRLTWLSPPTQDDRTPVVCRLTFLSRPNNLVAEDDCMKQGN